MSIKMLVLKKVSTINPPMHPPIKDRVKETHFFVVRLDELVYSYIIYGFIPDPITFPYK